MARFHGEVGYGTSVEDPSDSGVWVDQITEQIYEGDVVHQGRLEQNSQKVNDDISLSNSISILADQYAIDNINKIRYVRWDGVLWTVTSVQVQRPRLILNIGSVYNGPVPVVEEG